MALLFAGPACRVCGCTDDDCYDCYERTGDPCYWVETDLCSACASSSADSQYRRRPRPVRAGCGRLKEEAYDQPR